MEVETNTVVAKCTPTYISVCLSIKHFSKSSRGKREWNEIKYEQLCYAVSYTHLDVYKRQLDAC